MWSSFSSRMCVSGPLYAGGGFGKVSMPACPTASARGADNGEHARTCGWVGGGRSSVLLGWLRLVGQLVLAGRLGRLVKRVVLRFGPGAIGVCHVVGRRV